MDYGNLFVCLMGMGTVFFGLICLIALTRLMSTALHCIQLKPEAAVRTPAVAASPAAGTVTPEIVAAVSAAVAEDLGTDITGIRILSIKPL